jgi:beta-xylosidase
MEELHNISIELRNILREADSTAMTREQLMYRILLMSEEYMERYEDQSLKVLIEGQNDPSNPRYDYGLK